MDQQKARETTGLFKFIVTPDLNLNGNMNFGFWTLLQF